MLRIKSFNTWGDSVKSGSVANFLSSCRTVDVMCLQEVHTAYSSNVPKVHLPCDPKGRTVGINLHLFLELQERLSSTHNGYFAPQLLGLHDLEREVDGVGYGNAMFIKKDVLVTAFESRVIYRDFDCMNDGLPSSKSMQVATILQDGVVYIVGNIHGFWFGKKIAHNVYKSHKGDCQERREQNKGIATLLNNNRLALGSKIDDVRVILVGDLNYASDNAALDDLVSNECFGKGGGVHQNSAWDITDTRTEYYPQNKPSREADHLVTSQNTKVYFFGVDTNVPSDHAALDIILR